MKKFFFSILSIFFTLPIFAINELGGIQILPNVIGKKISPDGSLILGETPSGMATYNLSTGKQYDYDESYNGNGNCISEEGVIVGSAFISSKYDFRGVFMKDGLVSEVPAFDKTSFCSLEGITKNGNRVCGMVLNPNLDNPDIFDPAFNYMLYVPIYGDVNEDGTISDYEYLPVPTKDFFGAAPQYCTAVWISDDGNTIAGQVCDNTGMYYYPIVYKFDGTEWTYSLPSESLFNPNKLDVSSFPEFNMRRPNVFDYIPDEAQRERFASNLEAWEEEGMNDEDNPYNYLTRYTTDELAEAYWNAVDEYEEAELYYESVILPNYLDNLEKVTKESVFFAQNLMAMNSEGSLMAMTACKFAETSTDPYKEIFVPYLFDLVTGDIKSYENTNGNLCPMQLTEDGTIIAWAPQQQTEYGYSIPTESYIDPEGKGEFIPIQEYIDSRNPYYAKWMQNHLTCQVILNGETINYMNSGFCSVTEDFSILAGGVMVSIGLNGGPLDENGEPIEYFTYLFDDMSGAGINEIQLPEEGLIHVYNLQGLSVLITLNKQDLQSLPKGLYIINGKKMIIN